MKRTSIFLVYLLAISLFIVASSISPPPAKSRHAANVGPCQPFIFVVYLGIVAWMKKFHDLSPSHCRASVLNHQMPLFHYTNLPFGPWVHEGFLYALENRQSSVLFWYPPPFVLPRTAAAWPRPLTFMVSVARRGSLPNPGRACAVSSGFGHLGACLYGIILSDM
jgi:hypothetical protein